MSMEELIASDPLDPQVRLYNLVVIQYNFTNTHSIEENALPSPWVNDTVEIRIRVSGFEFRVKDLRILEFKVSHKTLTFVSRSGPVRF